MEEMYSGYDSGRIVPDDVFFYVNPKNFSRKTIPSTPESVTREAMPTGGITGVLPFEDENDCAPDTGIGFDIAELANRCSTAQEFFENVFSKKTYEVNGQNVRRTTLVKQALDLFGKSFYLNGMIDRLFVFPTKHNIGGNSEYNARILLKNFGIVKESKRETFNYKYFDESLTKFCAPKQETYYTTGFFFFIYDIASVKEFSSDDMVRTQGSGQLYGSKSARSIITHCIKNPVFRSGYVQESLIRQACGNRKIVYEWVKINYPEGIDATEAEFKKIVLKFREDTKDEFEWERVDAWKEHAKQLEKQIFKR